MLTQVQRSPSADTCRCSGLCLVYHPFFCADSSWTHLQVQKSLDASLASAQDEALEIQAKP